MYKELIHQIQTKANPQKAKQLQRFFKTGKGEYGEGDRFLGLTVPEQRSIAKQFRDLPLSDCIRLLQNPIHEYRLIALFVLIDQFKKKQNQEAIFRLYLSNTKHINNWDLIDLSAPHIVGSYLIDKDKSVLFTLAHSKTLWERRIAILAPFYFIRGGSFDVALQIAQLLVHDSHDLIHKAVGWMLREIGKRGGIKQEEKFLTKYASTMPRTMLRYAIEHFSEAKRKKFMLMKKKDSYKTSANK